RYLGAELQSDVSVCQRGGLRPGQRHLHLLLWLEGRILRRTVSRGIIRTGLQREMRLCQRRWLRSSDGRLSLSRRLDG
ncbi:unnamed protein product, partial [Scomber scombrus]